MIAPHLRGDDDGLDSLLQELEQGEGRSGKERVALLLNIGRELYPKAPDSAMRYVEKAESLAQELDDATALIECANLKGIVHYVKGEHAKALPHWKRVLELKKKSGDPLEISHIRNNLGLLHQKMGGYVDALEEHHKAYRIRDSLGKSGAVAESANHLGNVYYLKENFEKAEHYYRKALDLRKKVGDTGALRSSYNNMGLIHREKGRGEKALRSFRKAYDLALQEEEHFRVGDLALNISSAHLMLGNEDSSGYYIQRAEEIAEQLGDPLMELRSEQEKAELQKEQGHLEKALASAKRAFELADSSNSLPSKKEVSALLSRLFAKDGDHKKAYEYLRINESLNDSLLDKEKQDRMAKMEARFQARQKKAALERSKRKREKAEKARERLLIIVISGSVFFLLLSASLYYAYRQKKNANVTLTEQNQRIRKDKEEKELLLQELQHRVKNNLQLILSLMNLQSDRIKDPEAKQLHRDSQNRVHSMALLHQRMHRLENLDKEQFHAFIEELGERLIETYGKEGELALSLDVNVEGLGQDTLTPVALILNELLSNSLKYGFKKADQGTIRVAVKPHSEELYCLEVKDDGSGFEEKPDGDKERTYGLDLVRSLAEQIEGWLEKLPQEKGTRFRVYFKNMG